MTSKKFVNILKAAFVITLAFIMTACGDDESVTLGDPDAATLSNYIKSHGNLEVKFDLNAFAAGNYEGPFSDSTKPVNVIFYPIEDAVDFRYYETNSLQEDPENLILFNEKSYDLLPVFNGEFRKFVSDVSEYEAYGRVVVRTLNNIHISKAIQIESGTIQTEYNNSLVRIDTSAGSNPSFTWRDGLRPGNVKYFQGVVNPMGDLMAGTFTEGNSYQYKDFSTVIETLHLISDPLPDLEAGINYRFVLMGISATNWVNMIADTSFTVK